MSNATQALLATLGTVLVAIIGAYATRRASKTTATATPYEALAGRVTHLEQADEAKNKRLSAQDEQIKELLMRNGKLDRVISGWGYYYDDLSEGWLHYRTFDQPPHPSTKVLNFMKELHDPPTDN